MPVYERRLPVSVPAEALHDWHARPGALQRLVPPWEKVELVRISGTLADMRVVMRMHVMGPLRQTWEAFHDDHVPGRRFRDVQLRGPFARWVHTHRFEPAPTGSELVDHIDYTLPLGPLGALFGGGFARARIARMFEFRHQR
ncbi:MAG: SRPBCC family protein, partial [Myxococcota bacterium]